MKSFVFNSFKKRYMNGEVPPNDKWKFNVVNSNIDDYEHIESYRTSGDFIKIGGLAKYNDTLTNVVPVNFSYHELTELDNGYTTSKPMFINYDNWDNFYTEYKVYVDNWDVVTKTLVPRRFYGSQTSQGITLHDMFFNYTQTGTTETGEPIITNIAPFARFKGFYWITTKEELAWCADRVNGDINGVKSSSFNNEIAIVLGDNIGTTDKKDTITDIISCIGKYDDRPFEGLLFGNGFAFTSINLVCKNDNNGLVGVLGKKGKIHYIKINGDCQITCDNKINIEHIKNKSTDVLAGIVCGKNYGEILACTVDGNLGVNNFIPAVYCVNNKSDAEGSDTNPDANTFYPNYMCINSPGNIIPYIGYFNEGVFGSNGVQQIVSGAVPGGVTDVTCPTCFGKKTANICTDCSGYGYINTKSNTCTSCSGYGYSALCPECSGTGIVTFVGDDEVVEIECSACYSTGRTDTCPTCSANGVIKNGTSDDIITCPTCSGYCYLPCNECHYLGTIKEEYLPTTYSSYMMKTWSNHNSLNKLDNTGVKTIQFNTMSAKNLEKMMATGKGTKGYVTFYDENIISKTLSLAELEAQPDLLNGFSASETDPNKLERAYITEPEYSANNGYTDKNGSKVPLNSVTLEAIGVSSGDNAALYKTALTKPEAEQISKLCILGENGNKTDNLDLYDDDDYKEVNPYDSAVSAMPYSMLDQSMKMNIMSRAAYYVSPLVGMNKSTLGNCYVNETVSSSGTFVGFFGGAVGKQCGGKIENVTVNLNAVENEDVNRDVFKAVSNNAEDNSGVKFTTYVSEGNPDPLYTYAHKKWSGTISFPDKDGVYYDLSADLKIKPSDNYAFHNTDVGRNKINYTLSKKKSESLAQPLIPVMKGFNLSLSGFSGVTSAYKNVLTFPTEELYNTFKLTHICDPYYDDDIADLMQTSAYGFLGDAAYIQHVNLSNYNYTLSNYTYESEYKVNIEEDPKLVRLNEDGTYPYPEYIVEPSNFNLNELARYVVKDVTIEQFTSNALVNGLKFINNSLSWARTSAEDGTWYYENTEPIIINPYTTYDNISAVFEQSYTNPITDPVITLKKHIFNKTKRNIDRYSLLDSMLLKMDITDGNNIVTEYPKITYITIQKLKFKTTQNIEYTDNVGQQKIADMELCAVEGITLIGVVFDDVNHIRTDYKFWIPYMDMSDTTNFIDKCTSRVDDTETKIIYSDKYTRDLSRPLTEIFNRTDGIYGLLNSNTWDQNRSNKLIQDIAYYQYYNVSYNDVDNYACTLYSIRNIGALIGSLVVNNNQYILNNKAYLHNKQGILLQSDKTNTTDYNKMTPIWKDYSLLNRYGAFAAICEYHSSNIGDLVPNPLADDETIKLLRPVKLVNNTFAYREEITSDEQNNRYIVGPMKMGNCINALSMHVAGHKIYGIASPLIAELKPVTNVHPSVFKYNNGVYAGINESGFQREGETNQYLGEFTTDMGIRGSARDPFGWVTNIALDTPGCANFGYPGKTLSTVNPLYALDTRYIAGSLFDWTTTTVDTGNVAVTATRTISGADVSNYILINPKAFADPYNWSIDGVNAHYNAVKMASCNKVLGNGAIYNSTYKYPFKWAEPTVSNINIGYGFTTNPIATITVPYNSFKDVIGNEYPHSIYGFTDITRYEDLNDTVDKYTSKSYPSYTILRPDVEQLIPYEYYDTDSDSKSNDVRAWFKNYKRKNRYPYFGSSIRLIRDDDVLYPGVPGYNNIFDGKYINDCVPSYTFDSTNMPKTSAIFNEFTEKFENNIYIPPVEFVPNDDTYERFTYTYDKTNGTEFNSFEKDVEFNAYDNKLGYWITDNISGGVRSDSSGMIYNGNILTMGYTKSSEEIRNEIIKSDNGISYTSGISGNDIQGLLVQDSSGNNVMYIDMGLGDCDGYNSWSYSGYPSTSGVGCKGLLLEVK